MIYEFKNIYGDDLDEILCKIEDTFKIRFGTGELKHIENSDQLSEYLADKLNAADNNDCTSQQAFYKIREAIAEEMNLEKKNLTPDSKLELIIPRKKRKIKIQNIENKLGFKLNILVPPIYISVFLGTMLMVSLFGYFIEWQAPTLGLCLSILLISIANKFGKEFKFTTIGEIAEHAFKYNYSDSRREHLTYNKNEIKRVIHQIINDEAASFANE